MAFALAAVMSAALAGCGAAGTESAPDPVSGPASEAQSESISAESESASAPQPEEEYVPEWRIAPELEAAHITGMQEQGQPMRQQEVFSHLLIQQNENGGWRFLNAVTGRMFPEENEVSEFPGQTFFGALPFYKVDHEDIDSYCEQIRQEEHIEADAGGHCGASDTTPIWTEDGLKEYEYTTLFPKDSPLEGNANMALYADLNSGAWQKYENDWEEAGNGEELFQGFILLDASGNRMNDTVYEDALPFCEGVAAVKQNGKWGYIDETGTPVTEFCYEPLLYAEDFLEQPTEDGVYSEMKRICPYSANEGMIPVKKDGMCGVIDTQGNEIVPLMFEDITSVHDGAVWAKENGKWGLLNLTEAQE